MHDGSMETRTMEITGKTQIMFVLAHPVDHVRASAVLNAHFRATGQDIAVSPLHVLPDDLGTVLGAIRKMRNVVGFGVTIPHKIDVIAHLDSTTEAARQVGAVNFVRRHADGTLTGDNLDGVGFVSGLRKNGVQIEGRRALQSGAGGAGRAVAFALAAAGVAELAIVNRDREKAEALAAAICARHPSCRASADPFWDRPFDLVVNTTSLGMKSSDPLPIDIARIDPAATVAEVVMTPPVTPLIEAARERGCKTVDGRIMLDEQMQLVSQLIGL